MLLGERRAVQVEPSQPPRIISWDEAGEITAEQMKMLLGGPCMVDFDDGLIVRPVDIYGE